VNILTRLYPAAPTILLVLLTGVELQIAKRVKKSSWKAGERMVAFPVLPVPRFLKIEVVNSVDRVHRPVLHARLQ
jgi:hypothetical protein